MKAIERDKQKFENWLSANGAEIMMPTNPYEFARFIANGGTHVVYSNKKGQISANGFALDCVAAFENGKHLSMGFTKTQRTHNGNKKAALIKRDGSDCFYCRQDLNDDITIEHLIALDKGGNNRLENMALAHSKCNALMGNLSLTKKLKKRDEYLIAIYRNGSA